jgi:hypothetical protein
MIDLYYHTVKGSLTVSSLRFEVQYARISQRFSEANVTTHTHIYKVSNQAHLALNESLG